MFIIMTGMLCKGQAYWQPARVAGMDTSASMNGLIVQQSAGTVTTL
jgi:hypothetical protein